MSDCLTTNLLGVMLKNPIIAASGTFGFGNDYDDIIDVSRLGAISGKGLTLNGSAGNDGMRVLETPAGMLNSIGLENPGIDSFVKFECGVMRKTGAAVIANLGGHSMEDYAQGAQRLNDADIDILELNISCPNVKSGGMAFGMEPESAASVTRLVKELSKKPVLVKLSPNAYNVTEVAIAVENAGADGISLVNTFLGMAVDIKTQRAVFSNIYAGLSGPCIFPLALRMVHQVAHNVDVPVVGMGGIASVNDALAMMMVGAKAVQVGAATFAHPATMINIIDGLEAYCLLNGLKNISEICGII